MWVKWVVLPGNYLILDIVLRPELIGITPCIVECLKQVLNLLIRCHFEREHLPVALRGRLKIIFTGDEWAAPNTLNGSVVATIGRVEDVVEPTLRLFKLLVFTQTCGDHEGHMEEQLPIVERIGPIAKIIAFFRLR